MFAKLPRRVRNCIMQRQLAPVAASSGHKGVQPPQQERRQSQQYQGDRRRRHPRERDTATLRLERQVEALIQSIAGLQHQNLHLFESRGTHEGAPANLVATFYRLFEHGLVPSQRVSQDQFVRSMMARDVQGADYRGVEALVEQWRLCSTGFVWTRVVPRRTEVVTLGESTLVIVDVVVRKRLNRSGVECMCPSIGGDESAMQSLLATALEIHGSVRFYFDVSGRVTWFSAEMDVISGLLPVLGSLSRVNACLQRRGIHQTTAVRSADPPSEQSPNEQSRPPSRDSRHNVAFLLS